jgi:hypothetical protein
VELLAKPEILTSYIYGPMFDNAESRLFLFAAQCFKIESMQKVIQHVMRTHVLRRPIVLLVFVVACVFVCNILILLIKSVRCSFRSL